VVVKSAQLGLDSALMLCDSGRLAVDHCAAAPALAAQARRAGAVVRGFYRRSTVIKLDRARRELVRLPMNGR